MGRPHKIPHKTAPILRISPQYARVCRGGQVSRRKLEARINIGQSRHSCSLLRLAECRAAYLDTVEVWGSSPHVPTIFPPDSIESARSRACVPPGFDRPCHHLPSKPRVDSDPHFHQQMVYAVASQTLRRFESALGRTIRNRAAHHAAPLQVYVYPHAMREPNAFTAGNKLLFGDFIASAEAMGRTLPGQTVCRTT
jgi:hypothetical protein